MQYEPVRSVRPMRKGILRRRSFFLRFVAILTTFLTVIAYATTYARYAGPAPGVSFHTGGTSAPQSQRPALPPARLAFSHLTTEQGLSSDAAEATVQDGVGFIWIATLNGLNRYDGSQVVVYQNKADDPASLSNNEVNCLFVDSRGNLWAGTNSGLNVYDRASDRFKVYFHDLANPASLSANTIRSIYEDRTGIFWIGTDGGGLDKFDPSMGIFTAYRHNPADPTSLSNDSVRTMYEDRAGNLWVATYGGGLDRLDPATGTFSAFRHDPANSRSISSDFVMTLSQDQGEYLWVGTWGGGLNLFDPTTGIFTAYRHDLTSTSSLSDDRVTALCVDNSGELWVGTFAGGVGILDAPTGHFTAYPADASDPDSLSMNRVVNLYRDSSGLVWVSTEGGGVNLYNPQQRAFTVYRNNPRDPASLASNVVLAVYEDRSGMVWVGMQDHGLDRLDPLTGKVTHYPPDPSNPQKLGFPTVAGITGDGKDGVWVATYGGGLYHLDPATGTFTGYHHDPSNPDSLSDDSITALARDNNGTLWLSTATGLDRFDPAKGVFTTYQSDPANTRSLTGGLMNAVMVARDGTVWISGPSGLNHLDTSTGQVTRYTHDPKRPETLSENYIFKVYQDASGTIWAAGFGGTLNRFDPRTGGFKHFLQDSAPATENILSVLEEQRGNEPSGNLWVIRSHSIVKFDAHTEQYRVYTTADGLPNAQASRAGIVGNKGELLLGGTDGLIIMDPAKVQIDTDPPPVAFTDFLIGNKQVPIGGNSVLQYSIDQTNNIQLSYEDRIISFEFAALNFRGPGQVRYRYMLEGFDSGWNEVGSTRRLVTYTNLPAGNYTFRVTASNGDGVWNPTGRTISLVVTPPWWETLWFRVAAIVLVLGIAGGLFWLRIRGLEQRQRALERAVSERTAELTIANASLEVEIGVREEAQLALESEIGVRKVAELALQKSNQDLLALHRIAQSLTEWTDLKKALGDLGTTLSGLFGGAGVSIWALDEQRQVLTRLLAVSGEQVLTENPSILLEDDPVSSNSIDKRDIEVLDNQAELPLAAKPPDLPVGEARAGRGGVGAAMLVPLLSHGDPVGLLCIRASSPEQTFTEANTGLAWTVGSTLANALENARLLAAERAAAAEEERRRLAGELHDSVTQSLYAANLTAGVLIDLWSSNPERGRQASIAIQDFTKAALAQMRTLLVELRPAALVNTSLVELLGTLRTAIVVSEECKIEAQLAVAPLLPPEVQIAFYRIAQEALNNIVKHSRAQNARINLKLTPPFVVQSPSEPWCGTVMLLVADDGQGFDPSHSSDGRLGMSNMRERAAGVGASLNITSYPREGTQVEVNWTGCARVPDEAL